MYDWKCLNKSELEKIYGSNNQNTPKLKKKKKTESEEENF